MCYELISCGTTCCEALALHGLDVIESKQSYGWKAYAITLETVMRSLAECVLRMSGK